MKFETSALFKKFKPYKLKLVFGNFYLCDKFIVGELFDGVHLDWESAELLIHKVLQYYEEGIKLVYIANRINDYSIDPHNWTKFEKKYNFIVGTAIVTYSNLTYRNVSVERHFTKKHMKRCLSLDEAIYWVENQEEFS